MSERDIEVEVTGEMPLIMHWDNIEWADELKTWIKDPVNNGRSTPGDDRTPPWTWIGYTYHDGDFVAMPHENFMKSIMEGGKQVKHGRGTFKVKTQSGIVPLEAFFPFENQGAAISIHDIYKLREEDKFSTHIKTVREMGFDLLVKRAAVDRKKHIRVRPRFNHWSFTARLKVLDDDVMEQLETILHCAGNQGIGDWRPSSKVSPGPFGRYKAKIL